MSTQASATARTRRTQADRSAATRDALVAAARRLFAAHGFAEVSTDAIVAAAGVTRGALYHQFADKTALFEAALAAVEADIAQRLAAGRRRPGYPIRSRPCGTPRERGSRSASSPKYSASLSSTGRPYWAGPTGARSAISTSSDWCRPSWRRASRWDASAPSR
jgi:AcrR family transcriptional regulator